MDNKKEGLLSCGAAFLVLFTCVVDPVFSACMAVVFLLGIGFYHVSKWLENY